MYFVHVIVVCASDDDSVDVGVGDVLCRVDIFEVGEDLKDGLPFAVICGFEVGPVTVVVMHVWNYYGGVNIIVVDLYY